MKDSKFKSKEALIEESLIEFGSTSYENASLNRIIKNAKVSKGSFYYHFKNKEDLYQHLLKEGVDTKWEFINQYTKDHASEFEQMDIFDKFLYQAQIGLEFASQYPKYNDLGNMFAREKGTDIYDKVIETIGGESSTALTELIRSSYNNGELNKDYPLEFVENLLEKLFANYEEFFGHSDDIEQNLSNLEAFIKFLKTGLAAN